MSLRTRFTFIALVSGALAIALALPALAATSFDIVSAERIDRSTVQATVSITCDPLPQ
jgi:hypothetical protein